MFSKNQPTRPRPALSRREFLRLAALSLGGLSFTYFRNELALPEFPKTERLGRVAVGMVELKMKPDPESPTLGVLYEDAVVPWLKETAGARTAAIFNNQRWVETPDGYIYGPYLQPVYNRPNQPVEALPPSSRGAGMWVEVTVPFAEAALNQAEPSSNSWVEAKLQQGLPLRVYYSQTFWVDEIRTGDGGQKFYCLNPNYYGGVDKLWVAAEAFRPVTQDELTPIHPDVTDKEIVVDAVHQLLSCYEGANEVYFAACFHRREI